VVARSIYTEVREGRGSEHGGVFLDISHKPAEYVKKKLPSMYHQFLELADVDITKGPMEVGPTCHYMMGGVRVEAETGQSSVPGLYAAGEAAAGLHGANRLGGNSLSDLLVFGRRAGLAASEHAKSTAAPMLDATQVEDAAQQMLAPFERSDGESPYVLHKDLQETMQKLVGIFRTDEDLKEALTKIAALQERAKRVGISGSRMFNPGWHLCRDMNSMLTVSEAVARCALARRESRGAHSRLDYPNVDATWAKQNNVISLESGGAMNLRQEPTPVMPEDLQTMVADEKIPS
jgi:succinate dehydrogenase / fumarate reductase flavoprotein subunit